MTWFPWFRRNVPEPPAAICNDSLQAVEDSRLILETARARWKRVDEAAERADAAREQMRAQRERNHFKEIVIHALHGERRA